MNNQQQNNDKENEAKKAEHDNDPNTVYTDESSTLESRKEFEPDEMSDNTKDVNKITAKKIYGDPELNKGLESQAKDEES